MFITITVIALFIQFAGVYALFIHAQRTKERAREAVDPANQRSRQAYYNAFADRQDKARHGGFTV